MSDNEKHIVKSPDNISRADALAAIEAIYNDCPSESVQRALFASALAAINALPAVTVTDDMVERACETIGQMTVEHHTNGLLFKDVPEDDKPLVRKIVRAALEAALPNPPVSGEEM